jgi:16S rRNA (guanine527-N7)-methyltransferase
MTEPAPDSEKQILFRKTLNQNGLEITDDKLATLGEYVRLLLEWNSKVNLVSRKDQDSLWETHLLHSLSPLFHLLIPSGTALLDLGTGGGLPGIPLAILRPDLHFVLVDSIRKKMEAVQDILNKIPVGNVRVTCGRAEDVGKTLKKDERVDVVIARAVAPAADLARWSFNWFKRPGGRTILVRSVSDARSMATPLLILLKGGDLTAELGNIPTKTLNGVPIVVPLVFKGHAVSGLEDKKLVIVSLH